MKLKVTLLFVAQVTLLNRSEDKARQLADELGARFGGGLDRLGECDHDVLCVLSKNVLDIPDIEHAYHYGKTILEGIPEYARQTDH